MSPSLFQCRPKNSDRRRCSERGRRVRDWIVTRCLLLAFIGFITTTQMGCQIFRKFGGSSEPIPVAFDRLPTQQQLLSQIQSKAESVGQLASNVSVTIPGTPKIKGTLQVEFPNRMRMKAGLLGVSEMGVDVGSNEEHFWIWSRASTPGQPPAFYFANHVSFKQSKARRSVPLDPKWVIEGLGLVRFNPTDVHYGPVMDQGGRMKLFTVEQTSNGPQTRVTLLAARTGVIEQQAMYDSSNQLIAYMNSSEYASFMHNGRPIGLPQRIELHMIQPSGQDTKMVINLSSISLEPLYGNASRMWAMPNPEGVRKIDLSQQWTSDIRTGFPANSSTPQGPQASGARYQR